MGKVLRYYGFNIYAPRASYKWPYMAIVDGDGVFGTREQVERKINNWWHAQMEACTYHGDWRDYDENETC